MSYTYHLVCIDCRVILDLGKIIAIDEDGRDIPWQFGGWIDLDTHERLEAASLDSAVERFLILHRGHELRVVPDRYLAKADPECQLRRIETVAELFSQPISPEPDPEDDVEHVPSGVTTRLTYRSS
jgi:hypothetical protein